ncbi:virulence factor Mce family protein [Nocardioides fonticola]|uniref:Virulence factor Mce family protein n=1 Tax=Nocardioides fonticola TaxID=450363 RepID=A0ABP7XGV0_9ACTN
MISRLMNKRFAERNPAVLGVVGAVLLALIVVGSLSAARIKGVLTEREYHARFTEAAGLRPGDDVRVAGLTLGTVSSLTIEDDQVEVAFRLDKDVRLGSDTQAEIKSATVLGRKFLQITPKGDGELGSATIPVARTRAPFDLQSQLEGLGGEVQPLKKAQLARALDTVSDTFADTPDDVRAALEGVRRGARVIASRDGALLDLLRSASQVSGILATRSGDLTTLVRDANDLLAELTARRTALRAVLINANALLGQLRALAEENDQQIGPALDQLARVSDLLKRNRANLTATIEGLRNYTGSLGEAVNGGPWFYGYIANLVPSNMAQQTVDSILSQTPTVGGSS